MQFITGTIILCKRIKKKQRALEQGAKNPELQKNEASKINVYVSGPVHICEG
jgi:hypothetical protein